MNEKAKESNASEQSWLGRNWPALAVAALSFTIADMAAAEFVGSDKTMLVGDTVGRFVHDSVDDTLDDTLDLFGTTLSVS